MESFAGCLFLLLTLIWMSDAQGGVEEPPDFEEKFITEFVSIFHSNKVINEVFDVTLNPEVAAEGYHDAMVSLGATAGESFQESLEQAAQLVADAVKVCFSCQNGEDSARLQASEVAWGLDSYTRLATTGNPQQLANGYKDSIVAAAAHMLTDEVSKLYVQTYGFFQFLVNASAISPHTAAAYGQFYSDHCPPCSRRR